MVTSMKSDFVPKQLVITNHITLVISECIHA